MGFELYVRNGEPFALPACIASVLCKAQLQVKAPKKTTESRPCMLKTGDDFEVQFSVPAAKYICLTSTDGVKVRFDSLNASLFLVYG